MNNLSKHPKFTLEKSEKYTSYFSKYIAFTPVNEFHKPQLDFEMIHDSEELAQKYFDAFDKVYEKLSVLLADKTGIEGVEFIIACHLKTIECWTCPIMWVSKFSLDELCNHIITKHQKDIDTKKSLIKEVLDEKNGNNGMSKFWREEEKMFDYAKFLGIDMGGMKHSHTIMLDGLLSSTSELLKELNKANNSENS